MKQSRRLSIGAEVFTGEGVHFRVWALHRQRVDVILEGKNGVLPRSEAAGVALEAEGNGYYSGIIHAAEAGTLYRYRLDGEASLLPDPASRFQPQGPHGPSEVIDPSHFSWSDAGWNGVALEGQVIYEMHIGTFTREGTWASAARELPELAKLGVTMLEIMPIADFPGRFGWGYDGVNYFAPTRLYGTPDDCRLFVDQAHALGLGVILDVVYNHVGPDGNYLKKFAPEYFTDRHENEWGEAINFDSDQSGPVREFFLANAGYWIEEFHLDGLRLDATQQIFDSSTDHILAAITRRVREAARGRRTYIVAENEVQHTRLVRPADQGGYGIDALWNDDFHHSAMVAMTGRSEAYYSDYRGAPQELISAIKWGFLFQGQRFKWQKKRRGTPALDLPPERFVTFIQNHDQIANSGHGLRSHVLTSPGRLRAMTALLLLAPATPMLFQGQEFAASSPFQFFADHQPDLAKRIAKGRADFLAQFPSIATPAMQAGLPDPADPELFKRCQLDFADRDRHAEVYALHRDLLRLRRDDRVFCSPRYHGMDGAVLGPAAFVLRFFATEAEGGDRLLLVNLGRDLHLDPSPEPLLAPPQGRHWYILWSSEDPTYGGSGTPPMDGDENWRIPGEAAVALISASA